MIFVTVGTHFQPFQRLLDALPQVDLGEVVLQYGPGEPPAGTMQAEAYLPFDRMLALFEEAEKVITHAGVGSVLCARRAGHVPLVVPRRHDLGEHVDEHQSELAAALERRGSVVAVRELDQLAERLAAAPARGEAKLEAHPGLTSAVRGALGLDAVQARRS